MPQPMEHRLVHLLLLWIIILTLGQLAFIAFFFTAGQFKSQSISINDVAPEPTIQTTGNNKPLQPIQKEPDLVLGKMLTFKATEANLTKIKWKVKREDPALVFAAKENLIIKKDGYYFLCLQVTLDSQDSHQHTVILNRNSNALLEGRINTNSISTGFLGRVEELAAGDTLMVTIAPPARINNSNVVTHLNVIYLSKPSPL